VTGTATATDNRPDLAPAATGAPAGARVSRAAVADPTVSVWGIAAAAVLDHTPADRPAHERARAAGISVRDYARGLRELAAAGHLPTRSRRPPSSRTHAGAEAHLAPLVDGRWAYRVTVHHHTGPMPHEHLTGIVDSVAELMAAHAENCCPITTVHDRFRPRTQSRIVRAAAHSAHPTGNPTAEALSACVDHRVIVPAGYGDPWLVAADASVDHTGHGTWAVVTGAGWVRRGSLVTDPASGRSQLGELIAVIEAMRTYRAGSTITLLTDSTSNVRLITLAQDRARKRVHHTLNGDWLAEHRNELLCLAGALTIVPRWHQRNHPMIALADAFTRSAAPPNVTITHTSICGPDDPDHIHCPNDGYACSMGRLLQASAPNPPLPPAPDLIRDGAPATSTARPTVSDRPSPPPTSW
jgi:ribonuclease HI